MWFSLFRLGLPAAGVPHWSAQLDFHPILKILKMENNLLLNSPSDLSPLFRTLT